MKSVAVCRLSGTRDGVVVDALVRLCDAETVREGAMRKAGDPWEASDDASFHRIAHIGEDPCRCAGPLKGCGPVDHRLVGLRPEIDVSLKKLCEFVVRGRMA